MIQISIKLCLYNIDLYNIFLLTCSLLTISYIKMCCFVVDPHNLKNYIETGLHIVDIGIAISISSILLKQG